MLHQCRFCTYQTPIKSNLRRHIKYKHGNHSASNPHPYVHRYLHQQPNPYPQCTPEMIANNTYYTKEIRAPVCVKRE